MTSTPAIINQPIRPSPTKGLPLVASIQETWTQEMGTGTLREGKYMTKYTEEGVVLSGQTVVVRELRVIEELLLVHRTDHAVVGDGNVMSLLLTSLIIKDVTI